MFTATVLKNVDFPEALSPPIRIFSLKSIELATGSVNSG